MECLTGFTEIPTQETDLILPLEAMHSFPALCPFSISLRGIPLQYIHKLTSTRTLKTTSLSVFCFKFSKEGVGCWSASAWLDFSQVFTTGTIRGGEDAWPL